MKKIATITEKIAVLAGSIGLVLSLAPAAYATGGAYTYSAYGPYGPHIPEDTGFASMGIFTIAAIVSYGLGIGFLTYSKILKEKFGIFAAQK